MKHLTLSACLLLATAGLAQKASYAVDAIPTPPGLDPQIGGLAFLPDGRVAACFHRGEVYTYDPAEGLWTLFADGLQEPLGITAEPDGSVVVMQRPELTRLHDEDGDGKADWYETISDDFGMSGNYHEFAFGPARGPDGRYYVGLNTASNGAGIRKETRGEVQPLSRPGRMYACVPWRGCIVAIDPETGELEPYAFGVRSPDGLGFGPDGRLYVSDNQGDWLGTSKLFRIEPKGFHGHVSSLVWMDGWDRGNPLQIPVEELDEMRTRAAILFPQGIVANSPTQPVWIPEGAMGPFAGQMLIGEMNSPRILRVMLEEVAGQMQGAVVTFLENKEGDGDPLPGGVHRLAFDDEGGLWTGHTALSWAGGKGLRRIRYTGEVPFEVLDVSLTEDGFEFEFTRPLGSANFSKGSFEVTRYWYRYHRPYGSDRMDTRPVEVTSATISKDGRKLRVSLAELRSGRVHQFKMNGIRSASGKPLAHDLVCYNLVKLLDGTEERPQWAEPEKMPEVDLPPVEIDKELINGILPLPAERGALFGAELVTQHGSFEGTGYVDYQGASGERIEYLLVNAAAKRFDLSIRYALASGKRRLQIELDGKPAGKPFAIPSSGGWDKWAWLQFPSDFVLPKGEHRLALVTVGDSGPNIDTIRLSQR